MCAPPHHDLRMSLLDTDGIVGHSHGRAIDLPPGRRIAPVCQDAMLNASDFVGRNRRRSYGCIAVVSTCPTARCPLSCVTPCASAVAMHVTHIG